jgi:biopolymer transport protein TolQ
MRKARRWILTPQFAVLLTIFAFVSIVWLTAGVSDRPDFRPDCAACADSVGSDSCICTTTGDLSQWGVYQKVRWERIYAYTLLFLLSLWCFALMIERWITYTRAGNQSSEFKSRVYAAIYGNRFEDAINIAALYPESPVAAVVSASLQIEFDHLNNRARSIKAPMWARQHAIVSITEDLKRGLWMLAALGWTMLLTGVFLFVSGLINALHGLRAAEGTHIYPIAGSLAEALWATIFTMLVSIPIIWSHKYFASKVETFSLEMERLSLAITDQIASQGPKTSIETAGAQYTTRELTPLPTHHFAD